MSRFFLAIELSSEAIVEVQRVQKVLANSCDGVYKLTPANQFHITLYFCGETPVPQMDLITKAIESLPKPEIEISLKSLKILPQEDVPRVLAVSIASPNRTLEKFQQRIHDICFAHADYKEIRPFAPHITFARLDKNVPANAKVVKRSIAALGGSVSEVSWKLNEVVLVRSERGDHEVVQRIPLVEE